MLPAHSLGGLAGCDLLLKAENLQRAGSFKVRGAANKIAALTPEQKASGVIAASAGNHAQGVALAAGNLGIPCTIVMPSGASLPKVEATRGYGATVLLQGDDFDQAQKHARHLMRENAATFIPAFDDPAIIAGQGTIGLEMLEQADELGRGHRPRGRRRPDLGYRPSDKGDAPRRQSDRRAGRGRHRPCRLLQGQPASHRAGEGHRGRRHRRGDAGEAHPSPGERNTWTSWWWLRRRRSPGP